MKKRVTMAEIAKVAGVHTTTVSMALREHKNLPRKTIDRIKEIAEKMGYYPDPALSALNAYRYDKRNVVQRGTLAYLTNWNAEFAWRNHSAHRRFYEGAEAQANQLGFRLEHIWFGDPQFRQERINSILLSRGIHGLIFASWLPQNDCNPGFDWDQFCYIKIDYFPSQVPMNYITNDQQSIIQTAYQKLWEKGFRRIGLVMPKGWDDLAMKAWSVGYLLAKENVGCFADVPVLCYDTDKAIGSPDDEIRVDPLALKQWMQVHRPDAILSFRPYIENALAFLEIKPGVHIGYADLCRDPLDTETEGMVNHCEQVGCVAVSALVNQIFRNETGKGEVFTKTLVEGEWSGS